MDKTIINATREAAQDSLDVTCQPSLVVYKVRIAIGRDNIGGRQAWYRIMKEFHIDIDFNKMLSRWLLQNIHCTKSEDLRGV